MNLGLTLIVTTLADGHMLGLAALLGAMANLSTNSRIGLAGAALFAGVYVSPVLN